MLSASLTIKEIENALRVSVKLWYHIVNVWESDKSCGNTSRRRVFPQVFPVLPNFIETRKESFRFLCKISVQTLFYVSIMVNGFRPISTHVLSCLFCKS